MHRGFIIYHVGEWPAQYCVNGAPTRLPARDDTPAVALFTHEFQSNELLMPLNSVVPVYTRRLRGDDQHQYSTR